MKILIIDSHPYKESFNRQLTRDIAKTIGGKHLVEILNLVDDGFSPTMTSEELSGFSGGISSDHKVADYQQKVKDADLLVFSFPIWWASVPAILKGFIDKVFLPGYAFEYSKTGMLIGLLHKEAVVISTMQTPKFFFKHFLNNPIKNHLIRGTLSGCGIKTRKYFMIDKINSGNDEYRKKIYTGILDYFNTI